MIQLSDLIKVDYFQLKEQPRTGKQKAHQWLQAVEPTIEIRSVFSFTRLPDQIMSLEDNLRHVIMMTCQPSFLAAVRRNWKGNNRCQATTSVVCSHLHYCRYSDFHDLHKRFNVLHRKVASLMLSREVK